jgi:hypothetical protein
MVAALRTLAYVPETLRVKSPFSIKKIVGDIETNIMKKGYHALGFDKLNKFIDLTKLFETKTEQKSSRAKVVHSVYVRLIKKV